MAAGRIPTESVFFSLASRWQRHGVKTEEDLVSFAVWVDNYYAFGKSLDDAIFIAESFEAELATQWGLKIKPSSRSILSPAERDDAWYHEKWPRVLQCDVLGHLISADASPWPCWRRTEKSMRAAFWANCVGPCTGGLSLQQRCRLLDRCVRPHLHFRNTRWPFTKSLAEQQNRIQRRMLSFFVRVERLPTEDLNMYNRRRMRNIAAIAKRQGTWSSEHAKRVVAWAEHLQRPLNHFSLASKFYLWRGPSWLQQRRLSSGVMRPGTRSMPGFLPRRWDESVEDARSFIKAEG